MSVIRMIDGRQVTLRDRWYHGTSRARMAWMGAEEWQPHPGLMLTNTIEAGVHYAGGLFITVNVPEWILWEAPDRPDISSEMLGFDRGNVIGMRSTVGTDDHAIIIQDGVPGAPNALALVILSEAAANDIDMISIETLDE